MATDPIGPPAPPSTPPWALPVGTLARAVGMAADPRKLILASAGLVALWGGWALIGRTLGEPISAVTRLELGPLDFEANAGLPEVARLVAEPPRVVASPFVELFTTGIGPRGFAEAVLLALWGVAVWGLVGGAIARIAVVEVALGRRIGLGTAVRFALSRGVALVAAPLTPMVVAIAFAAFSAGFGLLYRIPGGVGATIAAFLTFLPLLAALGVGLILLGLAVGWPLMHATIAAEGEDTPDALSRSYSYVNQRLPRYAALALGSWAVGVVGLILAALLARVVLSLSDWGIALGAPRPVATTELAETVRGLWLGLVGLLVRAWIYSYFWTSAAIIYLLLRKDVDGTEIHDIYLPAQDADTFAGDSTLAAPAAPTPDQTAA